MAFPRIIAIMLIMIIGSQSLCGQERVRTTRGNLKRAITVSASMPTDSLPALSPDSIILGNYDKPLRSAVETIFVTNRHASVTIEAVTLQIDYYTMTDSMMHSRSVTIGCHIPPGATRQLSTRAWDRQQAFYYYRTRIRHRVVNDASTHRAPQPYKVKVSVK